MTLKQIQDWELSFVKSKGIAPDEKTSSFIAISKLVEEVGETSKDLLEGNWKEIQAEVADVIIFACKIANIAETYHGADKLSNVMQRKIKFCETRKYNKANKKFNKPKHKEFK